MKATTAMTTAIVIALGLLLFTGTLVSNNVLATKKDSGSSSDSNDGKGSDKGGSNHPKPISHNNDNNKPSDTNTNTDTASDTKSTDVSNLQDNTIPPIVIEPFGGCGGSGHGNGGVSTVKCPHPTPTTPTHCPQGEHFVQSMGCVGNNLSHDEAFDLGCKMGSNDGQDQENFVGTGPHSGAFIAGYNQGFGGKSCHRHHDHGGSGGSSGSSSSSASASATALVVAPTVNTTIQQTGLSFTESNSISSNVLVVLPTTHTVDVAGWLHIVGDIKNNGKSSVTIEPQISGRVMNANNQTIGIEYATPLSTTIQPGQSTAFEMLVGGTGIPNLSDISSIQYHVGIVASSK